MKPIMNKLLLLIAVSLLSISVSHAQKKSELILRNRELRTEIDTLNTALLKVKQSLKIATVERTSLENQVSELKAANGTLLKNMSSFATLSSQNSANVKKALAAVERKEEQLKSILGEMTKHDSVALAVFTQAKQLLGDQVKIGISDGIVVISDPLSFYFKDGLGTALLEATTPYLVHIATLINNHPSVNVSIIGMTNTGEFDVALQQATIIVNTLLKTNKVDVTQISPRAMDGGFKDGVQIRFQPNYKSFYTNAKSEMKNYQ